jgi:hypothetical protein
MSDILNTSFAVLLQPLQQIHPRTMHSHTRHPLLPPSLTHQKEENKKRTGQTKCTHKHVVRGITNPSMLRQGWRGEQNVSSSSHGMRGCNNLLVSMNLYALKTD